MPKLVFNNISGPWHTNDFNPDKPVSLPTPRLRWWRLTTAQAFWQDAIPLGFAKAAAIVRNSFERPLPGMSPPKSSRWSSTPRQTVEAGAAFRTPRYPTRPMPTNPSKSIDHVAGSGTAVVKEALNQRSPVGEPSTNPVPPA
jgi:hypothetical protein